MEKYSKSDETIAENDSEETIQINKSEINNPSPDDSLQPISSPLPENPNDILIGGSQEPEDDSDEENEDEYGSEVFGIFRDTTSQSEFDFYPRITNTICRFNAQCELDLLYVSQNIENSQYGPETYNRVVIAKWSPGINYCIYNDGHINVHGATTKKLAHYACNRIVCILRKIGFKAIFSDFEITIMMGAANVGFKISLKKFFQSNRSNCLYCSKEFGGVLYKSPIEGALVKVIKNGKIEISGIKSIIEMYKVYRNILPTLQESKRA